MESPLKTFSHNNRFSVIRWIGELTFEVRLFPILLLLLVGFKEHPLIFELLIFILLLASHLEVISLREGYRFLLRANKRDDFDPDASNSRDGSNDVREGASLYATVYSRPNSKFYKTAAFLLALFRDFTTTFHILIGIFLAMSYVNTWDIVKSNDEYNVLYRRSNKLRDENTDEDNTNKTEDNYIHSVGDPNNSEEEEEDNDSLMSDWDTCTLSSE